MAKYYIRNKGKVYGPAEENKINGQIKSGFFEANCYLSTDQQNWIPANQVLTAARVVHLAAASGTAASSAQSRGNNNEQMFPPPVSTPLPQFNGGIPMTPDMVSTPMTSVAKKKNNDAFFAVMFTAITVLFLIAGALLVYDKFFNESAGGNFAEVCNNYQNAVGVVTVVLEDSDGKLLTEVLGQKLNDPEIPIGTAFAIAENRFATNCHVAYGVKDTKNSQADMILRKIILAAAVNSGVKNESDLTRFIENNKNEIIQLSKDLKAKIRVRRVEIRLAHSNGKALRVNGLQIHPRYSANSNEFKNSEFDVAILHTNEKISNYCQLADKKTLHELKVGQEIAYIGFPMEGLLDNGNLNLSNPEATYKNGSINKITDFNNVHSQNPDENRSIIHSIPTVGGASGSPVFLANGKVVAIVWGGNHNRGSNGRIASAAQHNMAVRIDALDIVIKEEIIDIRKWTGDKK